MESALPSNILPQNNRIAGQNLSGKVKAAKNYVYYITCSSNDINGRENDKSSSINDDIYSFPNDELSEGNYMEAVSLFNNNEYDKAYVLFLKEAGIGNAKAQYFLGYLFENGQGVDKDYKKAYEWYLKAAEQENARAQCYVGYLYCIGKGVNLDYKKAYNWYLKAADQGDVLAQYFLGILYENGQGLSKDYTKAAEWYKKSATQGFEEAKKALKRIEKSL